MLQKTCKQAVHVFIFQVVSVHVRYTRTCTVVSCIFDYFRGYSVMRWRHVPFVYIYLQQVKCTVHVYVDICFNVEFIRFTAKITRCGHIFCYSCVLHYLALVTTCTLILYVHVMVFDFHRVKRSGENVPFVMNPFINKIWEGRFTCTCSYSMFTLYTIDGIH